MLLLKPIGAGGLNLPALFHKANFHEKRGLEHRRNSQRGQGAKLFLTMECLMVELKLF